MGGARDGNTEEAADREECSRLMIRRLVAVLWRMITNAPP